MAGLRIVQITERDKMELSELGSKALHYMHQFLECLDSVTEGQISEDMASKYGERRGVPGTGRYSRYNRRDEEEMMLNERRGVPGTGRYNRRDEEEMLNERGGGYGQRDGGGYGQRDGGGYGYRQGGGSYGSRYDY